MPAEENPAGGAEERIRLFFAIWPPPVAGAELARLAASTAAACGGRASRSDSLHLTLAFLGAIPASDLPRLQESAARIAATPFDLTLDRIGCWPRKRLLWAGCSRTSSVLLDLQAAIARAAREAGHPPVDEGHPFKPHVTLVRKLPATADITLQPPSLSWTVDRCRLVQSILSSRGPDYRVVAEIPLRG